MPQQITSFLLALFIGAAPVATSVRTASSTRATMARLEVKISTTAPWTQVTLQPGRVAARRVISAPADVQVTPLDSGWRLNAPGSVVRTVVVRAVFEETTGAANIRLSIRKPSGGATTVEVRNQSASPFLAGTLVNKLPRSTTGVKGADGLTAYLSRTRAQLFGAKDPQIVHADPRRLVLAAYYPWFGRSYQDPMFTDRPAEPRGTLNLQDVLSMTRQARSAGIDGFVVSWQGEAFSGRRFDLALAAASRTNGVVTPYLEMEAAHEEGDTSGRANPLVVLQWLSDLIDRADDAAFLRSDGVPVVFVWRMGLLTRLGWTNVLSELSKRGKSVKLVGDANSTFGMVQWGFHRYNPNFLSPSDLVKQNREIMLDAKLLGTGDRVAPHLYVATVSPGYDDSKLPDRTAPIVERGAAGERYMATWDAALAAQADWILITSWNEWYEGTSVEPSVRFGDLALRQTAEQSARFGS